MDMKLSLPLMILLAVAAPALGAAEPVYREYDPMEDYLPHVKGDMQLSGSYKYWKDPKNLDWRLAGNPEENWKLNWKFMDPPFNASVHGGHFAADRGQDIFNELNGQGRRSGNFAACLGAKKGNLKGLRTSYPMYRKDLKHVAGLEEVIEHCAAREGRVLQNGSYDNSAVSLFIATQSAGMPIKVDVTRAGPMKSAYERGRKAFHARVGRINLACSSCHTYQIGLHLRGTVVTTPYGDVAHYPVYRTRNQLQSLHLRFVECNLATRTQPLKPGSQTYNDIEVFLTGLSNGYPVSVPSERD
jgi:sulfur-oxidizing protein SoxA